MSGEGELIIGVHVNRESSVLDKAAIMPIHEAIPRDLDALGLNLAQIFTHGPRFPVKNNLDYVAVKECTSDILLVVHSSYVTTAIWKDKKVNLKGKPLKHLIEQLEACDELDAYGLVVHIPKCEPERMAAVMKQLKPICSKYNSKLLIEMVSSKGSSDTYESPAKINHVTKLIGRGDWWGWCVDTAHIWGAGIDCSTAIEMDAWLSAIEGDIRLFHLNGSYALRGSGADKHAVCFATEDRIWHNVEPSKSGAVAVCRYARRLSIPIVCEINRGTEKEIRAALANLTR